MSKKECKVEISNFQDSKEFPKLMKVHNIKISETKEKKNKIIFTLKENVKEVEDIMIYTKMIWRFG